MSKKSTAATPKPRKARVRKPAYFLAVIYGQDNPVIVVAQTHKVALSAIGGLKAASPDDLIRAGKLDWAFIDTTPAPAPATATESKAETTPPNDVEAWTAGQGAAA